MHSSEYKYTTKEMEDKRILVIGGGESASEIAAEVCKTAKTCYMSVRNGVWFHDRSFGAHQPTDSCFPKHMRMVQRSNYEGILVWASRYLATELMWGRGGSGIKIWQPKAPYLRGMINFIRDVLDRMALGYLQPKRGVVKCSGNTVRFEGDCDDTKIDLIIFCTGFSPNFDFLTKKDGTLVCRKPEDCYKYVFDCEDPTLCYIGFTRPIVGSTYALAELQARWAAQVFSNEFCLPTSKEMACVANKERLRHSRLYPVDHKKRPTLVNHWEYADDIAKMMHIKPRQGMWIKTSVFKWWNIVTAPWSAFLYRLQDDDPAQRHLAYQRVLGTWDTKHHVLISISRMMLVLDFL
eukprot:CAMPEP_0174263894 /NCGR_PEP_ID=MMETSP0439-20130205/20531_1 /TAXON_ID=0 /ORGANISM="Stereomyxa ramosa, Strain Chinc5" /LENGTH=349 /DNA_ID=CAMNT_0015349515 /DNA_START=520 /DNA_END=1566 /DNA_ORIENTATION=-